MITLFPRRNANPTHRAEILHLGQFYLNATDDSKYLDERTIDLIKCFYNSKYLDIRAEVIAVTDPSPYKSIHELTNSVNCGVLYVYKLGSHNNFGIKSVLERAVHDMFHIQTQAEFTLSGELTVFLATAESFEEYADNYGDALIENYYDGIKEQGISLLYSEIYLQACAFDYLGRFPENQKVVLTHTPYKLLKATINSGSQFANVQ